MLNLWKLNAPAIDMACPDIYKKNYMQYRAECEPYSRPDNPLFIPETGKGTQFARRIFYPIGEYGAIGVSIFGVGRMHDGEIPESHVPIADDYRCIGEAMPLLAQVKKTGILRAAVEEEGLATIVHEFDAYEARVDFGWGRFGYGGIRAGGNEDASGRVLIGQLNPNEFILIGFDARVHFRPRRTDSLKNAQVTLAEEGKCVDGKWVPTRLLNGDQVFFGVRLGHNGSVVRVKLTKY